MPFSVLLALGALGLYLYLRGHRAVEARRAADPDEAPLAELARAGSNLRQPHQVEFFLYLPSETAADTAAAALRGRGFATEVRPEQDGADWLCLATRALVPTLPALRALRQELNQLADAGGGVYDGWGTTVTGEGSET